MSALDAEMCEYAGHTWVTAGGGLLVCAGCPAERWADDGTADEFGPGDLSSEVEPTCTCPDDNIPMHSTGCPASSGSRKAGE